ncbi:hypothetical protein O3P69_017230 [Scylla paramamosain]|uniref:Uncharacterized protein n=1 Tax=Scylla paramamosain TaxID=85552 RepID=A0AAW0TVE1_SCYPA
MEVFRDSIIVLVRRGSFRSGRFLSESDTQTQSLIQTSPSHTPTNPTFQPVRGVAVVVVEGVVGGRAQLPCHFKTRRPGDAPKLVLWYKESEDGHLRPLFSRDLRASQVAKHLSQPDGSLQVERSSSTLIYRRLTPRHAGLYECHIDFFNSPVHSSRVQLVVVEPVRSVDILEEGGLEVRNGVLGPYPAGHTLNVTCVARQGVPLPTVRWWTGGMVLKSSRELVEAKVENNLVVENISRTWHLRRLTCTANNSRLYRPAAATVTVHMTLLPVSVKMRVPAPLVEGQRAVLRCEAAGSNPAPRLSWTLQQIVMRESKSWEEGNKTCSELILNATRHLHLARVTCIATNLALNASLTNFTTLIVHYPPSVRASLGQPLRASSLKEGDNVYFTCSVAANPPATAITWFHEGRQVVQNRSAGVVTSRSSLVMRGVRRHQAGRYSCEAANMLARVRSATVTLTIKYRPKCVASVTTYFIYDKPVTVNCSVTSLPSPDSIYWQWEDRDEMTSVEPLRRGGGVATSLLTVAPSTNHRRKLYCWATNQIGDQIVPCNFTIREVGVPGWSCRVVHISTSSLTLVCLTPPQLEDHTATLYTAEVYLENKTLLANVTSTSSTFNVSHLHAGTNYRLKVYVTYGPVTSPPVLVSAYTSETPAKRGGGGVQSGRLGGAVGGMVVAVAVASAAVCARLYRGRRVARRGGSKTHHLAATTEDRRPMLRPGSECLPGTALEEEEEDEEDTPDRQDDEEAPMMGKKEEEEEEEDQVFRVVVDPLSCSAGLVRQKQEAASALHETKTEAAAAKEAEATGGEQLHIGEWMQLVPQECEDTLARKLQHVAGDKNHRRQQGQQQQQLGEWLQHVPGGWVLASSLHDPRLHLSRTEVLWLVDTPSSSGKLLQGVRFTLPREQWKWPPEDAYNNNSINTSSNAQHNTLFDTNTNFNRNSLFLPSSTTRDDLPNKRWSLPHPLRAETRRPPRRQAHEQEGSHPPALLHRLQLAGQPRPRSMIGREQQSAEAVSEHELGGQEQAAQEVPRSMRRLRFSEETIL